MLRIVVLPLFIFLFSMACMGQTFQYSRGWTNGKRSGAATTFNSLFHKDDDGLSELFEVPDNNDRKLERCLLQIQRLIRNPMLLHSSAAAALAINPSIPTSQNDNGNNNSNNNNLNTNPYGRNHQSNDLFEEMGAGGGAIIDNNDYNKH